MGLLNSSTVTWDFQPNLACLCYKDLQVLMEIKTSFALYLYVIQNLQFQPSFFEEKL